MIFSETFFGVFYISREFRFCRNVQQRAKYNISVMCSNDLYVIGELSSMLLGITEANRLKA